MKVTCILLALATLSVADDDYIYHDGKFNYHEDEQLISHSFTVKFSEERPKYVLQFNPCKVYHVTISSLAVRQKRGDPMTVENVDGGVGKHTVALEISGDEGPVTFELKVWGRWYYVTDYIEDNKALWIGRETKKCIRETTDYS